MKCPICGDELKPSKKDSRYMLCHSCRKKFKIPEDSKAVEKQTDASPRKAASPAPEEDPAMLDEELTEQTQVFSRRDVRAALRKANEERKAEKAALKAAAKAGKAAIRKGTAPAPATEQTEEDDGDYHFRYANLPPKSVREKQEREMRRAYDELLSIGKEERSSKKHGLFGRRG